MANHYRTRDGRWFSMALFNEQRQLPGFLSAIGRKDLTDDPRFATPDARKAHARLVDILDIEFAKRDLSGWREVSDDVGVTFGVVGTVDETLIDQQMPDSGALVPFADGKTPLTVSAPFQLEGVNKIPAKRAPSIGQHSDEILRGAGYSADEIGRLRRSGVVA